MDRTVDPTTAEHALVGRVDDCVDSERRDIGLQDFDTVHNRSLPAGYDPGMSHSASMRLLIRATLGLATLTLTACVQSPGLPSPTDLGNRIRVRIDGREIPSITTADYFIYAAVRGPDGTRHGVDLYAPAYSSSEGLSLGLGMRIARTFELPDTELEESLKTEPSLAEDILLPDGYTLCFEPGTFYAYRIIDHGPTMAADLAPEIRLGQLTKDGTSYVEVAPSSGPIIKRAAPPPNWPPGKN